MATQCDVSKGLASIGCKNQVAGLKNLFVINYSDEYDITVTSDDTDGHIMSSLGDPADGGITEAFKYPLKNTGNSFVEESESSRDAGTTVFNGTLNFVISAPNAHKQFQVKMLSWGRPQLVVESNSGDFFFVGLENGVEIGGNRTIEGEMTGANNYQLVGTSQERLPSYFLTAEAVVELKAIVSEDVIPG